MLESFDWLKPSPLWRTDGQDFRQPDFFRPPLLRFDSDDFMEQFQAAARPRRPDLLASAVVTATDAGQPLKLFQPFHGCFYLVCASLACRVPGFPDREARAGEGENLFFVLRRHGPGGEYGWAVDAERKGRWVSLQDQPPVLPGEERLPLSTTTAGNERLLHFGYVPVASGDTYAVPSKALIGDVLIPDPRPGEFHATIARPLADLMRTRTTPSFTPAQAQEVSLFLLLDLATFLRDELPRVDAALHGSGPAPTVAESDLLAYLNGAATPATPARPRTTLAQAIVEVGGKREAIAGLTGGDRLPAEYDLRDFRLGSALLDPDALEQRVVAALPARDPAAPGLPESVEVPKLLTPPRDQYQLRCVYERPQCDPQQLWVSRPSEPFVLAGTLDPEAPARTVRIPLPADVSIAGLRKFKHGVGIMMSDAMRNKVAAVMGREKEILKTDGAPGSEGGFELGFICSFSFQIIFIVAFFLLLMFVIILNLVFWWMAFFEICLPFPKKTG